MDYKEQISYLRYLAQQSQHIEATAFIRAAESITDLLDSVEAAKVRCETLEKMVKEYQEVLIPGYRKHREEAEAQLEAVRRILSDPLIVCGENNTLRPVKRTSKQNVYTTVLKAQKAVGVVGRWFPKEWEET